MIKHFSGLNNDVDTRDIILFGEGYNSEKYFGGSRSFTGIGAEELRALMELEFIDPEDGTSYGPTNKDMYDFVNAYDGCVCFGYAISPERRDYRVTIEGISYKGNVSIDMMEEFINEFRFADDFICNRNELYCWYD